jgi:8-oxo-dGTP diphosphatase
LNQNHLYIRRRLEKVAETGIIFGMPASDQGASQPRYALIPRVLIFLQRPGETLLIRGAPSKRLWANRYNGVGGHIERGEDPLSAARRELLEETGLTSDDLRLRGVITIDAGPERGVGLYVYTGSPSSGSLKPSSEGELEWVASDRLADLPLVEDLPALLAHLEALPLASPPFSAAYTYAPDGALQIRFA